MTTTPINRVRCAGTTKAGDACSFGGWNGGPLCLNCAAAAGQADARAELSERGKRGRKTVNAALNAAKRESCSLRSIEDLLTELERAVVEVDRSAGDIANRAKVKVQIVAAAHSLLKLEVVEQQNKQLHELLLQYHPELKKHLKAI